MPKIILMVPETESTITRPIATEVTRTLMALTGISEDATQIFFPSPSGHVAQPGSTLTGDALPNKLASDQRIKIEVDEESKAEDLHQLVTHRPENRLIFVDNDLDVVIRPVYATTTMTINFTYRAADKTGAERWRDGIKTRMAMMMQPQLLSVAYNFAIPDAMLVILEEIHRLREAKHGYGQSWPKYFNDNSSKLLSTLSNLIGEQQVLALSERQTRIPGMFDFEAEPEKGQKEGETEAWSISFSYTFQYAKAIACQMVYPLVVHNQPLTKFIPTAPMETQEDHLTGFSASSWALAHFESGSWGQPISRRHGYAIPAYDEFIPLFAMPATQRVVTSLVLIDDAAPNLLMNLAEIDDDFAFKPEVLDFLKSEVASLPKPYQSIFHVSLYGNVDLMPNSILEVRNNLDVVTTRLLSPRQYYHVRLSLVDDLRRLDRDALERARIHGVALVEILKALEPSLEERGLLPPVTKRGHIRSDDLEAVMRILERPLRLTDETTIKQFNTVQTLFIKASK